LRCRRPEIERAVLLRVQEVTDSSEPADPEYVLGVRAAVRSAVDYSLAAIERGEEAEPVPLALLAQARLAARTGVKLETVLRRYFAGYTVLGDFIVSEAEKDGGLRRDGLKRLLATQAHLLDRVLASVGEEHARERRGPGGSRAVRIERVRRLVNGDLHEAADLGYDLELNHVAVIAVGEGPGEAVRELAVKMDLLPLVVPGDEQVTWAWLGSRRKLDPEAVARRLSKAAGPGLAAALGECASGLAGWKLTHRQAMRGLGIALYGKAKIVRYADVAILASALRDEVLVTSLHAHFLAPLEGERDSGAVARETLRAFFAADRNISSAAAALGVSRQTVGSRLRSIEERIGRSLARCATELEIALQLEGEDESRDFVSSKAKVLPRLTY
jgi:hypothetical protein